MAFTKPTEIPDWAVHISDPGFDDGEDNDVVDGESHETNVVVPATDKKKIGWEYTEKPPRQYFNWFMRRVCQWIRWIDSVLGDCEEGSWEGKLFSCSPDFIVTFKYKKIGSVVTISWPTIDCPVATYTRGSGNFRFNDTPGYIMPASIRPTVARHFASPRVQEATTLFSGMVFTQNASLQLEFGKDANYGLDTSKDIMINAGSITYKID
jgi:hypothetical protein